MDTWKKTRGVCTGMITPDSLARLAATADCTGVANPTSCLLPFFFLASLSFLWNCLSLSPGTVAFLPCHTLVSLTTNLVVAREGLTALVVVSVLVEATTARDLVRTPSREGTTEPDYHRLSALVCMRLGLLNPTISRVQT